MRYMMLIYTNEADDANLTQKEQGAMYAAYGTFTTEVRERDIMHSGDALQPTTTAMTVRLRDGETVATDGPFAETKEQLGGFYILDCKDQDEAISFAAKIPGAQTGSIEIRPIMELG